MTSLAFYAGLLMFLAGLAATALPVLGSRIRGILLATAGAVIGLVSLNWPAPRESNSKNDSHLIDRALPRYNFREIHRTRICAPAERVYDAVKHVRAGDIGWLGVLTTLRGLGNGADEEETQPVLETALNHGFVMLADHAPTELVLGTAGPFWRITRLGPEESATLRRQLAATQNNPAAFLAADFNGYPKAVFNFSLEPGPRGCQMLTTETRIGGGSAEMMTVFARYWRVIWPGSALIRRTWLDAIRQRAEQPPASSSTAPPKLAQ